MNTTEPTLDHGEVKNLAARIKGSAFYIPFDTAFGEECQQLMLDHMQSVRRRLNRLRGLDNEVFAKLLVHTTLSSARTVLDCRDAPLEDVLELVTEFEESAQQGPLAKFIGKLGEPLARIERGEEGEESIHVRVANYIANRDRILMLFREHYQGEDIEKHIADFDKGVKLGVLEQTSEYVERCYKEEIYQENPDDLSLGEIRQLASRLRAPHGIKLARNAFGDACRALIERKRESLASSLMRLETVQYADYEDMGDEATWQAFKHFYPPAKNMSDEEFEERLIKIDDAASNPMIVQFLLHQKPPLAREIWENGEQQVYVTYDSYLNYIAQHDAMREEFLQMFPSEESPQILDDFDLSVELQVLHMAQHEALKQYRELVDARTLDTYPRIAPRRLISREGMEALHTTMAESLPVLPFETQFDQDCVEMGQRYFDYVMVEMARKPRLYDETFSDVLEEAAIRIKKYIYNIEDEEALIKAILKDNEILEHSDFKLAMGDTFYHNEELIVTKYLEERDRLQRDYRKANNWRDVEPELAAFDRAAQAQIIHEAHRGMVGSYINELCLPARGRGI